MTMIKKLGELKVDKYSAHYEEMIKALEDAGFVLVLDHETLTEKYYIVAESEDSE